MKFATSVIATAILASSAFAGLVSYEKGSCPSVSSIAYSAPMATPFYHKLLYIDATSMSGLDLVTKVLSHTPYASSAPNLTCEDLGQFPYTTGIYTELFDNTTATLEAKLLYFDSLTGSQLIYSCIDESQLVTLINYGATKAGISLPSFVSTILSKALLGGHYNLFIVLSNATSISASIQAAMVSAAQTYVSNFSMASLAAFDWTGC